MDPDYSAENFPPADLARPLKRVGDKKKPGRTPKVSDEKLSPRELAKRNARRERNKNAATRCREKKRNQTADLEAHVEHLTAENEEIARGNEKLRAKLDRMKAAVRAAEDGLSTMNECNDEIDQFVDNSYIFEYVDEQMEKEQMDKEPTPTTNVFEFPEPAKEPVPEFNPEELLKQPVNPAENFMAPEPVQKVPMEQMYPSEILEMDPFDIIMGY
jgi:regulator of replication initiation timing